METIRKLILENRAKAKTVSEADPTYYENLAKGQSPHSLWIGCCDSRVLPAKFLNINSGEMFMHTNIANQANPDDKNFSSCLEYAVNVLKVEHIIVCGHTQCGGVKAALDDYSEGVVGEWIKGIKETKAEHASELTSDVPREEQENRLIGLNVKKQVDILNNNTLIQKARADRGAPQVHGWVFQIEKGLVEVICE